MDPNQIENQERLVRVPHSSKSPRTRQYNSKLKFLRSKEVFLTDTQTSDYTKSSYQSCAKKIIQLEECIFKLKKQNKQLQQEILQLRKKQFLVLNQQRLKQFLIEMQDLKKQVLHYQNLLEKAQIQSKVLITMNKNLKIKLREIKAKGKSINGISSKQQEGGMQRKLTEQIQSVKKNKNRQGSSQSLSFKTGKSEPKINIRQQLHNGSKATFGASNKVKDQYFIGKNKRYNQHRQKDQNKK